MQYTAVGDAMNTCSRLQNIAKAGEIIISEGTMLRCSDRIEHVALTPVEVKGKRDKMRIYNVVGLKGEPQNYDPTSY
jgi:adenylate cyclase